MARTLRRPALRLGLRRRKRVGVAAAARMRRWVDTQPLFGLRCHLALGARSPLSGPARACRRALRRKVSVLPLSLVPLLRCAPLARARAALRPASSTRSASPALRGGAAALRPLHASPPLHVYRCGRQALRSALSPPNPASRAAAAPALPRRARPASSPPRAPHHAPGAARCPRTPLRTRSAARSAGRAFRSATRSARSCAPARTPTTARASRPGWLLKTRAHSAVYGSPRVGRRWGVRLLWFTRTRFGR